VERVSRPTHTFVHALDDGDPFFFEVPNDVRRFDRCIRSHQKVESERWRRVCWPRLHRLYHVPKPLEARPCDVPPGDLVEATIKDLLSESLRRIEMAEGRI